MNLNIPRILYFIFVCALVCTYTQSFVFSAFSALSSNLGAHHMAMKRVAATYQWEDGSPTVFYADMSTEVEECGVILISSVPDLYFGEWQSETCDQLYPYVCKTPGKVKVSN